jgi:hypothetical protein
MAWTLVYSDEFKVWLDAQAELLQEEALANLDVLEEIGPSLGRPRADTLKGSTLKNLKALRFEFERSPIRILYAFDSKRQALIILAGDKSSDKRWYEKNIPIAERIFAAHLEKLKKKEEEARAKEKKNR